MSTTTIVLIRHGQAQAHVDGVVGGDVGCVGLSELGRRQAEATRDRFLASGELGHVDALYSSTLPRAIETAEVLAPALGGLSIETMHDLREIDPGPVIDGRPYVEVDADFPRPERIHPYRNHVPEAEPWALFAARVGRALHHLAEAHAGQKIVVACHGGVIDVSFSAFHNRGIDTMSGVTRVTNCGITEWDHELDPSEYWVPADTWTLVRHNDASHVPLA